MNCSSRNTKRGTTSGPSRKPLLAISRMRPSTITEVSITFATPCGRSRARRPARQSADLLLGADARAQVCKEQADEDVEDDGDVAAGLTVTDRNSNRTLLRETR